MSMAIKQEPTYLKKYKVGQVVENDVASTMTSAYPVNWKGVKIVTNDFGDLKLSLSSSHGQSTDVLYTGPVPAQGLHGIVAEVEVENPDTEQVMKVKIGLTINVD